MALPAVPLLVALQLFCDAPSLLHWRVACVLARGAQLSRPFGVVMARVVPVVVVYQPLQSPSRARTSLRSLGAA